MIFKILQKKEPLNKNYIGFSVNTAGEYIEVYGLICEKNIKFYLPISRANNRGSRRIYPCFVDFTGKYVLFI